MPQILTPPGILVKTATEPAFRHELKYLITDPQVRMLKSRLKGVAPLDPHVKDGGYRIRSLYFDDYDDRCFYENENGVDPREKFRIRIYNGSTDRISLECKRKERGKTHKTACPLTLEQTQMLMKGLPLRDIGDQPPLLQKLTMRMLTNRMRPVVIVEYDRVPYIYRQGNVRITLDTNISSCSEVKWFLEPSIPRRPIMPLGQQLLEVKYDEFLPDFLYRSLALENLSQTAFSKYYLCRKYTR
ncbi:MAG: polyphosphate polymerase domain-containing protein [Eubacteriales bacterium]|nr:polyphosphate polymerase domain-containing protein [Eubacteriales bacterium]